MSRVTRYRRPGGTKNAEVQLTAQLAGTATRLDAAGRLESAGELATATERLEVLATRREGRLVVWPAQDADQRRGAGGAGTAVDRHHRRRRGRPGASNRGIGQPDHLIFGYGADTGHHRRGVG